MKKKYIYFFVVFLWLTTLFTTNQHPTTKKKNESSQTMNTKSGIYDPPCCNDTNYDPPGTIISEISLNRPAAGKSITDTTFNTTITALPDDTRNTYSQLQVWSHDNLYMITVNPDIGYEVRNAETFALLHSINRSLPRWIPGTHKIITVDNQPGRIFTYDADTNTEELLMNLTPFQFISSSRAFEELSRDGQWMSLYVTDDGSNSIRLVTVNLWEKRIAMNLRLQDMCTPDPEWGLLEPDWIGVSPAGNYAVVQWVKDSDNTCGGMELLDIETGTFVRRIYTHHHHSDLGLTEDGREIIVSDELAHPANNNVPAIVLYHLDGSPKEYLRMIPWFRLDHISCQGPPGLCLVTAGNDEGDPLLKGELYILYFDGSLRRIAHHRSNSCSYWAQPKATISTDGTRVAFSSDWRGNCSRAGGFVVQNLVIVDPPGDVPYIVLDRTRLNFGATGVHNTTGSQSFSISNSGEGTLNWTLASNVSWLQYSPTSGTGPASISISVNPSGLTSGIYNGTLRVTDPDASNSPQTVTVQLTVYTPAQDTPPIGTFETPVHGSTARSSIPVTGWALDNINVENVKIYRDPVPGENPGSVYIGDAVFVEGARPDVEQSNPTYPFNYRAGWGYMLLTNFLPNGGNGTFTLHAAASDSGGNSVSLGTKTITCSNHDAVKPFGAIDTPTQGGIASGSAFTNWGWVLTPQPDSIPTDGSTINVYVDGVNLGHPSYNLYREDIASFFPGYANSGGAVGSFSLDTTQYQNGVHTIQWTAEDNGGNSDGIGSRYFTVQNAGGQRTEDKGRVSGVPDLAGPVEVITGYNRKAVPFTCRPDHEGNRIIEICESERLEIHLGGIDSSVYSGYLKVGKRFARLPVGSTLDTGRGIFYWQPGPGFIGEYVFVFIETGRSGWKSRKSLIVRIRPRSSTTFCTPSYPTLN